MLSDDAKLIITGTFAVITLAWVLTHASQLSQVTGGAASAYGTAVGAILPK